MFAYESVPYWAREMVRPTSRPSRTERMLIRAHMLTDEEEGTIFELARDGFTNGAVPRTENEWGRAFTHFSALTADPKSATLRMLVGTMGQQSSSAADSRWFN